jgi:two-component system, OmpR family, sensor histidine kinase KdpD
VARGQLRVYLGSAPGVGKTYRMLDEGWRRRERGTDVVIGYVETHSRPKTDALVRDLEIVPRVKYEYRGATFDEMDLEAVLARKPEVALVDELAHTNAPGATNEKRWQDVEAMLAAGIDVITTVNIQHLESVNDVVDKITGITQQETVPDAVVRKAEQIELVDVTPEALRRRMAHGNIYTADKIDASLSNYFRVGNLSALRELALLWLADRVEDALQRYQDEHEIAATWETRERLIVGVIGDPSDEILLRRAARIASRTGAEIIAVHVVPADSVHRGSVDATLAQELVAEFDGKYREIVDDDTATALVAFARSERGTQIILGSSHSRTWYRPFGGVIQNVMRHSPDLDVHVISIDRDQPKHAHARRQKSTLPWSRRLFGLGCAAVTLPLFTWILSDVRSSVSLSTDFLVYLVIVLGLATLGGAAVGIVAGLAAYLLENYYFITPIHTLSVSRPDDFVALVAYLVFAVAASLLVSRFARRTTEADRARAEAQILAGAVATLGSSHEDLLPLLDSLRAVFDATSVAIIARRDGGWVSDVVSGEPLTDIETATQFPIDDNYALALEGVSLDGEDRQLVSAFAGRVANGLRVMRSVNEAAQLRGLADAEVKRSGLMRAVSSNFSESLSAIQFKVSSLLDGADTAPVRVQRERLLGIETEVQHLTRVVNNLSDLDRLETDSVTPHFSLVLVRPLVDQTIAGLSTSGRSIGIEVADDLPRIDTDPEMAQRVLSIVVENALRFTPSDRLVRVTAGATNEAVELLVVDTGPGIKPAVRAAIFEPPTRGDDQGASGIYLGLNVVAGFMDLLHGEVRLEDTPGGGLTVVLQFPTTEVKR